MSYKPLESYSLDELNALYDEFFPSPVTSPDYRPKSPELPGFTSEESDTSSPEEIKTPKRQEMSNKRKAEDLFDTDASPVNLTSFFKTMIDEPESIEIDFETEESKPKDEDKIVDKIVAEQCAIASLVAAQHNLPSYEMDNKLILNVDLPEHIVNQYIVSIDKRPFDYDLSKNVVETPLKQNRKLFVDRRLIQSLQLRSISSPEFIKQHFPFDSKLLNLDIKSLYNDDNNSWHVINSKLQKLCESPPLKGIFHGKDWNKRFAELLNSNRNVNYKFVAICAYHSFFSNKRDQDRNVTLERFNYDLFGKSKFKEFTISEIYSKIGINFITDYCAFPFYRDRILNQLENSHHDIMIGLIERERVKRKKIENSKCLLSIIDNFYSS